MSGKLERLDSESDSWERFMILWGSTPEIFIGSCIASLMGIIITYFITRNMSSQCNKEDIYKKTAESLNEKNTEAKEDAKMITEENTTPELLTRTCKKTLYKFASEKLEKSLTNAQINEEKETKRKQLEAIYNLMKDQKDLFGIENLNQVEEQMKLYG